jgi:uncharacterized coiled-coil protein SlyX
MTTKKTKSVRTASSPQSLTLEEIRLSVATQQSIIDAAKAQMDIFNAELRSRFETRLNQALAEQDKKHGQHTFDVDGVKLTAEVRATVKWDSTKLEAVARTMPWQDVQRVFKVEFSVPEKTFQAITDTKLLDQLIDARTVKYSEPKVTFAS